MPCFTQLNLTCIGEALGGLQVPYDAELKHAIALVVYNLARAATSLCPRVCLFSPSSNRKVAKLDINSACASRIVNSFTHFILSQ